VENGRAAIERHGKLADVGRMLLTVATAARAFLLSRWRGWHQAWGPPAPNTLSQWTCVRSSLLLARALERQGFPATLQSGHLSTDDGWVSHAWVEAAGLIIDITADQFGHAPVVITAAHDPAYRKGAGEADRLTPTLAGIAAVEEIWPSWCGYVDQQCG